MYIARGTQPVVRRTMKIKLAVAFAVLLFATLARADAVNVDGILLVIPDGSTVTSVTTSEPPSGFDVEVDYSFAEGFGSTEFLSNNGAPASIGEVVFTGNVSNLVVYIFGADFEVNGLYFNFGGGVQTDSTPIVGADIEWQTDDIEAGITSMSYTVDANVPEPSSLLLSGMGLAALIGLARRNRTMRPNAMAWVLAHPDPDAAK